MSVFDSKNNQEPDESISRKLIFTFHVGFCKVSLFHNYQDSLLLFALCNITLNIFGLLSNLRSEETEVAFTLSQPNN